jgi:hypothetical protein
MAGRLVTACAVCLAAFTQMAVAQAVLPDSLLGGTAQAARVNVEGTTNSCTVTLGPGFSAFKRAGSGNALVTFENLTFDTGGNGSYEEIFQGAARLIFSDGTSGTIAFDDNENAPNTSSFPFNGYSQSFSSGVLSIAFQINFPLGCNLPVAAIYRNHA